MMPRRQTQPSCDIPKRTHLILERDRLQCFRHVLHTWRIPYGISKKKFMAVGQLYKSGALNHHRARNNRSPRYAVIFKKKHSRQKIEVSAPKGLGWRLTGVICYVVSFGDPLSDTGSRRGQWHQCGHSSSQLASIQKPCKKGIPLNPQWDCWSFS